MGSLLFLPTVLQWVKWAESKLSAAWAFLNIDAQCSSHKNSRTHHCQPAWQLTVRPSSPPPPPARCHCQLTMPLANVFKFPSAGWLHEPETRAGSMAVAMQILIAQIFCCKTGIMRIRSTCVCPCPCCVRIQTIQVNSRVCHLLLISRDAKVRHVTAAFSIGNVWYESYWAIYYS